MLKSVQRFAIATCVAAFSAMTAGQAHAISVTPVVVDLQPTGSRMSQVVTIENKYARPVVLEIKIQEANYTDDGLKGTGKDSDDLLVFPPQMSIDPGKTQAIRIQYVGDPALTKSKHYFVTVAQLPVKLEESAPTVVQLLYNFQVVVGVGVPGARPNLQVTKSEVSTSGDGKPRAAITVTNDAATYGFLTGGTLRIVEKDRQGKEVFNRALNPDQIETEIGYGLIGAGQTRRIITPIMLPTAEGTLEARFTPSK